MGKIWTCRSVYIIECSGKNGDFHFLSTIQHPFSFCLTALSVISKFFLDCPVETGFVYPNFLFPHYYPCSINNKIISPVRSNFLPTGMNRNSSQKCPTIYSSNSTRVGTQAKSLNRRIHFWLVLNNSVRGRTFSDRFFAPSNA